MKALLGTKIGMTQIISTDGVAVPVTLIQAGPITVTQVKTVESDGYNAVQVAYGEGKKSVPKYIREFRVANLPDDILVGNMIDVTTFTLGDVVDATGVSKGKGFAGTVKRHNFITSRHTHGGKGDVRKPGSIGSMYPQKVFKGKRMAGRMGHDRVTVKNLVVSYIDPANNLIGLRGAVPGPKKGLIIIGLSTKTSLGSVGGRKSSQNIVGSIA